MKLDLRSEFDVLSKHLADRVRSFDAATNRGPGGPGPVKMIEVGFEYTQSAWMAVVFDTRPGATPDGEWNDFIDDNALDRPAWSAAAEANSGGPIILVQLDGTEREMPEDAELAEPIGELIKAVLQKARADGLFALLPKAAGCEFGVEHQAGAYGWPAYKDRGVENLA